MSNSSPNSSCCQLPFIELYSYPRSVLSPVVLFSFTAVPSDSRFWHLKVPATIGHLENMYVLNFKKYTIRKILILLLDSCKLKFTTILLPNSENRVGGIIFRKEEENSVQDFQSQSNLSDQINLTLYVCMITFGLPPELKLLQIPSTHITRATKMFLKLSDLRI